MGVFDLSFLEQEDEAPQQPAPKRARTGKTRAARAEGPAALPPPKQAADKSAAVAQPVVAAKAPATGTTSSSSGAGSGPVPRSPFLESPEQAWQKLLSTMEGVDMSATRGVDSAILATNANLELFKTMAQCYAVFTRLGHTEMALKNERDALKKAYTEVEAAKNVAKVALVEKEEVLQLERKTNEENRTLKSDRARFFKEAEAAKVLISEQNKKLSDQNREIEELKAKLQAAEEDLEVAEESIIEEYKKSAAFQRHIKPVFMEGFNHCKEACSIAFPDTDFSSVVPRPPSAKKAKAGQGDQSGQEVQPDQGDQPSREAPPDQDVQPGQIIELDGAAAGGEVPRVEGTAAAADAEGENAQNEAAGAEGAGNA